LNLSFQGAKFYTEFQPKAQIMTGKVNNSVRQALSKSDRQDRCPKAIRKNSAEHQSGFTAIPYMA
jgi:hypothetical protein